MVTVSSGFIGDFKPGDNVNYNLAVLTLLYHYCDHEDDDLRPFFYKPIILLLVSIIEAALHDVHSRISTFTREGVVNIASSVMGYVRGKQIDDLEKYIASARKHKLLGTNVRIYDDLDELRRVRNRVHIQDKKRDLERDERNVFTEARKLMAEKSVERTLKVLNMNYPRPAHVQGHVDDFDLPWAGHFPNV